MHPSRREVLRAIAGVSLTEFVSASRALAEIPMTHLALLGDSILDNAAYVPVGKDVSSHLKARLGSRATFLLAARDGARIVDVPGQLGTLPPETTHVIVSVGGNDALLASSVLDASARSVSEALWKIAEVADIFRVNYREMLELLPASKATCLCTIYEPRFAHSVRRRVAATALTVLNDVISREAFARGLAVLDLRLVCNEDSDFANEIEPSSQGGAKIAYAISAFAGVQAPERTSTVFIR